MNRKELFLDLFWEVTGSFSVSIAMYNFALQAEFPMTGFPASQ